MDKYEFPWLTYYADAPSQGMDYLTQLTCKPSKTLELYLRYKHETREYSYLPASAQMRKLVPVPKQNVRFNVSYKLSHSFKIKSRIELVSLKTKEGELKNGYLVYQDLIYDPMNSKLSLTFRYGLFETDDYDTRIYAYENEIYGAYSVPAHYNRGIRTYLILQYKIMRNLDFWMRWEQWYYSTPNFTIGSGKEYVAGNTKSEISAQVRYKF